MSTIDRLTKNIRTVKSNLPKLFANRDVTLIDHTDLDTLIVKFDSRLTDEQEKILIEMVVRETELTPEVEWDEGKIFFQF